MRFFYFLSIIAVAGLSFFSGYKLGQKKPIATGLPQTSNIQISEATEEKLSQTPGADTMSTNPSLQNASADVDEATDASNNFAERALAPLQTFTDTKGRSLIASIEAVEDGALIIRRQSDSRVLTLDTNLLSETDKAFADYLFQQSLAKEPLKTLSPSTTDSEIIWDQIFDQFE